MPFTRLDRRSHRPGIPGGNYSPVVEGPAPRLLVSSILPYLNRNRCCSWRGRPGRLRDVAVAPVARRPVRPPAAPGTHRYLPPC